MQVQRTEKYSVGVAYWRHGGEHAPEEESTQEAFADWTVWPKRLDELTVPGTRLPFWSACHLTSPNQKKLV